MPTYIVTSSYSGVTYHFYTVSTGGTEIANNTAGSYVYSGYTSSVGGTVNTLYVSVSVGGCESARTAVSITSTTPPTLSLTQSGAVNSCIGRIETITASGTGYTSYTWSPITNLYTNVSATTAYTGGSVATVYFKRSSATTTAETITCLGTGGGCENTNAVIFTVYANPTISTVTATPTPICIGSSINLIGASIEALAGSTTIGTETTTLSGSDGNPLRSGNAAVN